MSDVHAVSTPSTPVHVWGLPPVGDSMALFGRLARIEEQLREVLRRLPEPKPDTPRAPRVKYDPDVLQALADAANATGVPSKAADRNDLMALVRLHDKETALTAMRAVTFGWRNGKCCQSSPSQFLLRNIIAEAGKRIAQRGAARPVETWRPDE